MKACYIKQYIDLVDAIIRNFRPFLLVHKNSQYWSFLEIVNPSNCTKLDNLGILKQLYYLIYQCLERLELLELSNSQGLQKFTILEFWTKMSKSL